MYYPYPMKKSITLSVFFPAFNEEENIHEAITRAISALQNIPAIDDFEVIIVNDGSTDTTGEVAERLARKSKKSELFIMRSIAVMELRLRQGFAPRDLSIFFSQMLICNLILRKFQNCLNISPNTESCLDTARLASTDSCAFSTPRDGMF